MQHNYSLLATIENPLPIILAIFFGIALIVVLTLLALTSNKSPKLKTSHIPNPNSVIAPIQTAQYQNEPIPPQEANKIINQQRQQQPFYPINAMHCIYCYNTDLAYVTEYHKCLGARALFALLNGLLILMIPFSLLELFQFQQFPIRSLISFIAFGIIRYIVQIYIAIKESKTHVQCICKKCGKVWLHQGLFRN